MTSWRRKTSFVQLFFVCIFLPCIMSIKFAPCMNDKKKVLRIKMRRDNVALETDCCVLFPITHYREIQLYKKQVLGRGPSIHIRYPDALTVMDGTRWLARRWHLMQMHQPAAPSQTLLFFSPPKSAYIFMYFFFLPPAKHIAMERKKNALKKI